MKILFDQGTPVPLRRQLPEHDVATAFEQGWSALSNGSLLDTAEHAGFELLITTDSNLQYQQNLTERRIAIIVLRSASCLAFRDRSRQFRTQSNERQSGLRKRSRFLTETDSEERFDHLRCNRCGFDRPRSPQQERRHHRRREETVRA